jgi:hypothetical protein
MGDTVFRSILLEALMIRNDSRIDTLIDKKFDDIEVRREWRKIDITAVSRRNNTVVVIENKIKADESEKQLQNYVDIIESKYPKYSKIFIFLTLDGTSPKGSERYIPFSHGQVYELIKYNVKLKKDNMDSKVYDLIGYYLKILEEKSMPNEGFVALCNRLYRENKEAIETILEYGKPKLPPDSMRYFHGKTKTESVHMNKESINVYYPFIPCNWSGKVPLTNKYTSDRSLVFFYLKFSEYDAGRIRLSLDVGNFPDPDERTRVMELVADAAKNNKQFRMNVRESSKTNTRIFSKNIVLSTHEDEFDMGDYDAVTEKLIEVYEDSEVQQIYRIMDGIIQNFDFS